MTTFADMVTLLLAFFVLLASISKVDVTLYEQVRAGLQQSVGNRSQANTPLENFKTRIEDAVKALAVDEVVGLGQDQHGVQIEFASSSFYAPGSAEMLPDAVPILTEVAKTLQEGRFSNFLIEVVGHTDDTQVSTQQFPSNWELSAARATGVVRFFVQEGIAPDRLRAVGMADTAPKVPNRTAEGLPLAINQEINRRVAVRVAPR